MISLQEGQVVADRYRLVRAKAQGGMGHVWIARHLQLDVDVAVKFMADGPSASRDMRGRFEREAKAAALLKSPNVVQVYDYGVEDGTPYIVMELLEGEDLRDHLRRKGRLTHAATAPIVVQVCKALRRAHAAGLVHRDLKPANVFLARDGDDDVVKILDFGIVKDSALVLRVLRTTGCAVVGSPRYMSPEQVAGSMGVDHRTDLWALGVIVFRCLTGRLPFASNNHVLFLEEVYSGRSTVPSPLATGLGRDVDAFFERALSPDPAQRFQSAAELADAFVSLEWHTVDRPAEATPAVAPSPAPEAALAPEGQAEGERLSDDALPTCAMAAPAPVAAPAEVRRTRRRGRWAATFLAASAAVLAAAMLFTISAPAVGTASPAQAAAPTSPALPRASTSAPAVTTASAPAVATASAPAPMSPEPPRVSPPTTTTVKAPPVVARPHPRARVPADLDDPYGP